jgi:hypothetical protein
MGSPDPSAGRLALAPSASSARGGDDRPTGPVRSRPPGRRESGRRPGVGRRRLVVLTVLLTVAAVAYFAVTSLGDGGGGAAKSSPTGDAYQRANRTIAIEAQSMVQAGTDLRALRDIATFRTAVEAAVARIAAQVTALQRLAATRHGTARATIDETVASAQRLQLLGAAYERDVTKGQLGPANKDELSVHDEIENLAQQFDAWKR